MKLELPLLLFFLIMPVVVIHYLARVLCGRESRARLRIDTTGTVQYFESGDWIWWRVGLSFIVLPALIVVDRLLA